MSEDADQAADPAPRRTLSTAVVMSVGTAAVLAALGFASSALASRLLLPPGRGTLAAIQIIPGFLGLLGATGQAEAVTYFVAREPQRAGEVQVTGLLVAFLGTIVAVAIGALVIPLVLRSKPASVVHAAWIYLAFAPALVLITVGSAWLRATGRSLAWNLFRLLAPLLWTAVVVTAWLRSDRSATRLAVQFAVTLSLLALPITWLSLRGCPAPRSVVRHRIRPLLAYGLPTMATTAPQVLSLRLDQTVMTALVSERQLGYYVTAVGWSTSVSLLLNGLGFALFPAVARELDDEVRWRRFVSLLRRGSVFSAALTVLFIVVTPVLFTHPWVYGAAYRPAVRVGIVLVVAAGIVGFNQLLSESMRGLGLPRAILRAEVCGVIGTMVSLAVLLGPFGIMGAAVSSLIGYSIVTVSLWHGAVKYRRASLAG